MLLIYRRLNQRRRRHSFWAAAPPLLSACRPSSSGHMAINHSERDVFTSHFFPIFVASLLCFYTNKQALLQSGVGWTDFIDSKLGKLQWCSTEDDPKKKKKLHRLLIRKKLKRFIHVVTVSLDLSETPKITHDKILRWYLVSQSRYGRPLKDNMTT